MKIDIKELEKSEIIDELSIHEIKSVYRKIYSSGSDTTSVYEYEDRNEKSWMLYAVLVLLLSIFYIFSNLSAAKPVYIESFDLIVTPGTFIYPFSFLVIDLLSEFYGLKLARRAIYLSLFSNLTIVLLLSISTMLPIIPSWGLNNAYDSLISQVLSAVLASSLSFFLSEYVNSYVLCKIKRMTNSRYLFIRIFFSTLTAAIIDSFVFCLVAFYGKLSTEEIIKMAVVQIIIKFGYAFFNVFPAYLSRYYFNRYFIKNDA
ncbi:queuosine precursor transporter [Serratia sp. M24T3]|uniref:queuosine precursor transporter n=1 Tax=Serratia sp. M24T3 TaxID=932213 RepID=UPI001ED8FEF9|nr:queuosine precursor transporter [Serratia sp. M24T3]